MSRFHFTEVREEGGIALLIAVILLLVISTLGISALQHSREESVGGGHARHQIRNLHAADGVLEAVIQQLAADNPAGRQSAVCFGSRWGSRELVEEPWSGVKTDGRTGLLDSSSCDSIQQLPGRFARQGDSLDGAVQQLVYRVNVVAEDEGGGGGGKVGLQADYAVFDKTGGGRYR
jgi:hypothetical protein